LNDLSLLIRLITKITAKAGSALMHVSQSGGFRVSESGKNEAFFDDRLEMPQKRVSTTQKEASPGPEGSEPSTLSSGLCNVSTTVRCA
jgi:hypothetical protein